jgi:LysM repeat protein
VTRTAQILIAAILFVGFALPTLGHTQNRGHERYKVRKGDTLELLAAEYYGNREHKIYIMVENRLDHDVALKRGQRLKIPVSQQITTAEGDTLQSLAASYLGAEHRDKYLAEFNNLAPDETLALGQSITVPLQVNYRAAGNETLRNVALSLFADARQAALLRNYNDLESDELEAGQVIAVPVPKVRLQPSKHRPTDAEASERQAKRRQMIDKAQRSLPRAESAWRNGNFALVKRLLTLLDLDYLDSALATQAGVLLGKVYIAYEDDDSALASFSKVLARNPRHKLDPKKHSPKVRKLWQRAASNMQ